MNLMDLVSAWVSGVWDFFTELEFPGLSGVTFAALFVAATLAVLGIRLVFFALGLPGGGDSPRTSSTKNPKISEERKGDEF